VHLSSPSDRDNTIPHSGGGAASRAHLGVMAFLSTEWDARAIRAALDFGLIDALQQAPTTIEDIQQTTGAAPRGLDLLIALLVANRVVTRAGDRMQLTPRFREALQFRDLLEARIAFADVVWPDFHALFNALLTDVPQFMARSRTFDLFRYDRCLARTPGNRAATEAWTRFTTCLTRYEAPAALDEIELDDVAEIVDLGGNTGEFALAFCQRKAELRATVVDLPVVCDIGRDHLASNFPEQATRIRFWPCDMRRDALPAPADLVAFKSVLHDWPEADALRLIARARDLVRPGGRLMIFERAPLTFEGRPPYGLAPDLVFLHFLRPAEVYIKTLGQLGFVDIQYRRIELEVGFHLIVARNPREKRA
jgi:SAM-dependent methyltransferase